MHNELVPLSILTGAQTKLHFWRYVARDGLFLSAPHLTSALPGTPGCSVCKSGGSGRRRSPGIVPAAPPWVLHCSRCWPGPPPSRKEQGVPELRLLLPLQKADPERSPLPTGGAGAASISLGTGNSRREPQEAAVSPTATSNNCKIKPAMKFSSSLL